MPAAKSHSAQCQALSACYFPEILKCIQANQRCSLLVLLLSMYHSSHFNSFRTATGFLQLCRASLQDQYRNFTVRLMQSKSPFQRQQLVCFHRNTCFLQYITAYYIVCIHTKFGKDLWRNVMGYWARLPIFLVCSARWVCSIIPVLPCTLS